MVPTHPHAVGRAALLALAVGCAGPGSVDDSATGAPAPGLADRVLAAPGASDAPFGDPERAVNGVRGGGSGQGSTDVFSLADAGESASLTLDWSGALVLDGPGPDLAVFENPFEHPAGVFLDPVIVELSHDGSTWVPFPHDYQAPDETGWSSDPGHWVGFAGLTPVLLHEEANPVDPLDPELAGGDAFDLAALGDSPEALQVREQGACCIRLTSASAWTNPDSGLPYPRHPVGNGADIDGVYRRTD